MNSEELELSLRTEFESYLKTVLAGMRQEASEFQNKIEAEFDKHKSQFDDAFQEFVARFDADRDFDQPFRESVTEHLRLARDEGAKISANAFAEAQDLEMANAAAPVSFNEIRDAINDISTKDSQSAILKSLVQQATRYAPRGAFFIIKNEQFVGWKVFGTDGEAERAIREIHFPMSSDSILSDAVRSKSTVESSFGARSDDAGFLSTLNFGRPDRMYAIPLVARGRGVAVMYADYGTEGANVNVEALETLVRIAGLTVELIASAQSARADQRGVAPADFEDAQPDTDGAEYTAPIQSQPMEPVYETPAANEFVAEEDKSEFAFSDSVSIPGGIQDTLDSAPAAEPLVEAPQNVELPEVVAAPMPDADVISAEVRTLEPEVIEQRVAERPEKVEVESPEEEYVFDSGGSIENAAIKDSPFDKAAETFETVSVSNGNEAGHVAEHVVEVTTAPAGHARLSDRPVDLPIDVPDDERRLHNDARRFARLLVSEIKLYNEKKVQEGRDANDLYERLREAIDRSREMYDKRVQPPVASKFDYFHYELVTALAEGEEGRLGNSYPGSAV